MDLPTIQACIDAWRLVHKDGVVMADLFSQGNCFFYDKQTYDAGSPFMHVYPGILEDPVNNTSQLLFFLIPSAYDSANTVDIENYITPCTVMWTLTSNRVPPSVAKKRIKAWEANYAAWSVAQAASPDGVFLAFTVPMADFESDQSELILGLEPNGELSTAFTADLIIVNTANSKLVFDDYTRPVPPFGTSAASVSSFYLLQL